MLHVHYTALHLDGSYQDTQKKFQKLLGNYEGSILNDK